MPNIIFGNRIRSFQPESLSSQVTEEHECQSLPPQPNEPVRREKHVPVMYAEVAGVKRADFKELPAECWNQLVGCMRDAIRKICTEVGDGYRSGIDIALPELLEKTIPVIAYEAGRAAMESLVNKERGFLGTRIHCADCGEWANYKGDVHHFIMTRLGRISAWRAYYICPNGHRFHPLDIQLGVDGEHHFMPSVREDVALLTSRMPYAEAVDTITRLTPIRLSLETAERVTRTLAAALAAEQDGERQAAFGEAVSGVFPASCELVSAGAVAVVAADGGMCKIRNDEEYREFKVGVLGTITPSTFRGSGERAAVDDKHYIGHMTPLHPVDDFFEYLTVAYHRRGLQQCTKLHVVADGAECFWNRFDSLAWGHQAISKCLDFYHSTERIGTLATVLFADETQKSDWFKAMETYLWESGLDEFFHELGHQHASAICAGAKDKADAVMEQACYFAERRHLLRYKECREEGLPIGSGMVEGGIRFVGKDRLDRTGMKWLVDGAEAVLQLRCLDASNRWEEYFSKQAATRIERFRQQKAAWSMAA